MLAIKIRPSEEDLQLMREGEEEPEPGMVNDYFRIEVYENKKDIITAIGEHEDFWNLTVLQLFIKNTPICYTHREKILGSKKLLKILIRYLIR